MNKAWMLLLLPLGGCMIGRYTRPEAPVATSWPVAVDDHGAPAAERAWQDVLLDPGLRAQVERALENNRDLRIAVLKVQRARASFHGAVADHIPDLNADASLTSSRQVFGPGLAAEGTVYRAGLSVPAFELDLFGAVRYRTMAAQHQYFASEEVARAARISLIAEVATAWLAERSLAEQHALTARVLLSREEGASVIRQRFDVGIASELEVTQASGLVESARVQAAALARQHAAAEQTLIFLVGAPSDGEVAGSLGTAGIVADLPAGVPSEVLVARPDILAAEARLRAARANVGAARAAFFPRITLTGSVGTASPELAGLFGAGAGVWSFVPAISQSIFGIAGKVADLRGAKVDQQVAVAEYEKAIQGAFREVATALSARAPLLDQVESQRRLRDAEARRAELAATRYEVGFVGTLDRLDAERSLLEAERALIQATEAQLANAVALYAALGGGLK